MMLVKLGPLVQVASGKLGTVVFHCGKRSNVVARLGRPPATWGKALVTPKRGIARAARRWRLADAATKAAWRSYAAAHPFVNRLGEARCLSPIQIATRYALGIDPTSVYTLALAAAPRAGIHVAPVVSSAVFTAGVSFVLTVANYPGRPVFEHCFFQRYRQYGGRPGRGSMHYAGVLTRTGSTLDWYATFVAAGFGFSAGEELMLWLWWRYGDWFPSMKVPMEVAVV